jgi:hypothetical protein
MSSTSAIICKYLRYKVLPSNFEKDIYISQNLKAARLREHTRRINIAFGNEQPCLCENCSPRTCN